jgi:hypothetical protein
MSRWKRIRLLIAAHRREQTRRSRVHPFSTLLAPAF